MDPQIFCQILKLQADLVASKWLSQPDLTRTRAFEFIDDMTSILQQKSVTNLIHIVLLRLSQLGENSQNLHAFQRMFNDFQNVFAHIDTEHKCLVHFEKNLGTYFPPVEVIINKEDFYNNQANISDPENEKVSFQFFPIRETIKKFLEIPGVLKSTLSYLADLENDDSILFNFVQGERWKIIKRDYENRIVLPLFLYWDEYETNNPLGSHKGIGQIGAVYVVIACLHPQLQSKVENIFILTLFRSIDLEKVPLRMFFTKGVNELNFLATSGIPVSTPDGFTANYPCRFCHVKSSEMSTILKESQCKLRDETSYQSDLLADDLKKTGVARQSAISDLKSGSTLELIGVDPAHDIFEGIVEYDTGLILHQFIEIDDFFTLTELNSRVQNFDYGPNETNKPRPIKLNQIKNKHIKMSASEAFCFIRNLGLLIGDLVPRANEHWDLFITLREIIDIVVSPIVDVDILNYLESLIAEYLGKLTSLFKDCVKPKHHLLPHYPRVSKRFGPIWHLSTLRCESKNRISKLAAHASRNRQNITKTLAIKSQLQASDRFLRNENLELKLYEYQTSETLKVTDLPNMHLSQHLSECSINDTW
ncbi:uncharacterized protein LOC122508910 [Leptopilina heterotoma]|uniref:uncharacterized protein LOC122508910 n=1 Tax=Leptopilina heterotoma TaxID=63436 RepID=UPI001CAA19FE|nr:uncharacterized protein LOC122508910 [Leptopilina heterotoma]